MFRAWAQTYNHGTCDPLTLAMLEMTALEKGNMWAQTC